MIVIIAYISGAAIALLAVREALVRILEHLQERSKPRETVTLDLTAYEVRKRWKAV